MKPAHPPSSPLDSYFTSNPFEPPQSDPESDHWRRLAVRRGLVIWLMLFGLNLAFPLSLGGNILRNNEPARLGIGLAILAWGVGGIIILLAFPRVISTAILGAAVVAAFQFMPIPQIVAGGIAIAIVGPVGPKFAPGLGIGSGFALTFLTGFALILFSLLLGLFLRPVGRWLTTKPGPTAPPPRDLPPTTYPRLRPPP